MEFIFILYIFIHLVKISLANISVNNYNYRLVNKNRVQAIVGSLLQTSPRRSNLECATTCNSMQCVSYTYENQTRECRTYNDDEICDTENDIAVSTAKVNFNTALSRCQCIDLAPLSCADVPKVCGSGLYHLPTGDVLCDVDNEGGTWTVIANRFDGSVDFYRTWNDYKVGFGTLAGEFWIGFETLRDLMKQPQKLLIELGGWDGGKKYASYSSFSVGNEAMLYQLNINGFSTPSGKVGTGENMYYHTGKPFVTKDRDNEINCAVVLHGAWWYDACYASNLFGGYYGPSSNVEAMVWKSFDRGDMFKPVKTMRMMIANA